MSIPNFLTTTTAPPWTFPFVGPSGNVPPNFMTATCTLTFRSMSTGAKYRATGAFVPTDPTTGIATFTPSSTDLADAYAVSALGINSLPGTEIFEVFAEAVIGTAVYDDVDPTPQIAIRKI